MGRHRGAIAIRPIGARSRPSAERRNIADRGLAIIARAVGGDLGRCRLIGLGCAGVTKKFSPSVPRIASRCRGLAAFKKPDRPSASNPDISCATNDHAALSWSVTYFGFSRARQIAGIMIPTRSMISRNSAIFQPHVTGAIEAIAIPNPTMQARTMASFPPLMRASSCRRRSTLWRSCNGVLSSAIS